MKTSLQWAPAVVAGLRDLTPTVREFVLQPQAGCAPCLPGSHLQLEVPVAGRTELRSYSVVGADEGGYRIAVKRLDQGRGGSLAMWRLAVGDSLRISEPQNHFALDLQAPACLLVAGGIGITPLVGMAQLLAARGSRVRMLYAARSQDELAYAEVLEAALGPRLQRHVGRRIAFAQEIAQLPPGGQLYVCGPVPMLEAARQAWTAAGRKAQDLRFETFGSSGRLAPQPFRVRVPRHGLDITVPATASLLDALEAAGVQALADCRRGECGLCAMDVLAVDGEVDHRDVFLGQHEKRENRRICACVSRAVGCITLDSAWRPEPSTAQ